MRQRTISVRHRGREVDSPVIRGIILAFAAIVSILGIIWFIFVFTLAIVTIPIWVPLNAVLKYMGRRGFVLRQYGGWELDLGMNGFRRV